MRGVPHGSAARLGVSPQHWATVISYETRGTFSPRIWGGRRGRYMGLIQFGPRERREYGASERQAFVQQVAAAERYLQARGFRPGMSLLDLYSTINAGRPGRYHASDRPGQTVETHVRRTHFWKVLLCMSDKNGCLVRSSRRWLVTGE
jgi:hypothetical protein